MTSCTVVECDTPPLVPVIVRVDVPGLDFLHVVTVNVEVDVVGFGLNDAVPLVGRPATLSDTLPLNPLTAPMVTV